MFEDKCFAGKLDWLSNITQEVCIYHPGTFSSIQKNFIRNLVVMHCLGF